ncbi:MAG: type II toxin-antitoxin system RelE/ParE family toxin [Armatimonadota bacterium]
MRVLVWSPRFKRAFRRLAARRPDAVRNLGKTLRLLAEDPFQPGLRSHRLRGKLAGVWSCSAGFDLRILFDVVANPETGEEEILLLTLGTHEEVY